MVDLVDTDEVVVKVSSVMRKDHASLVTCTHSAPAGEQGILLASEDPGHGSGDRHLGWSRRALHFVV